MLLLSVFCNLLTLYCTALLSPSKGYLINSQWWWYRELRHRKAMLSGVTQLRVNGRLQENFGGRSTCCLAVASCLLVLNSASFFTIRLMLWGRTPLEHRNQPSQLLGPGISGVLRSGQCWWCGFSHFSSARQKLCCRSTTSLGDEAGDWGDCAFLDWVIQSFHVCRSFPSGIERSIHHTGS